ncbi:hypothetical protein VFPPC_13224 [Pochonia chlamydosporia 170]|uniref:DUF2510 domain-containing protein n=1 Tax=Pochonia chlamydosporia 170 TaxID=1380566 RepID=A0A179F7B0_METCM|nr:hypothetical protein VFPPC_13224 [Pochonia chlamydosporia 170]OAQ61200.1 hypothetical protein VFPPC_13224 [Pochonia chlamydosporia 170]
MSSRRQRYTLGHGVYAGEIVLDNGETIWVEYLDDVVNHAVSALEYLQDAVEYIAARICEVESYNSIQIRSIFHSTTIQNGRKVHDRLGHHLTFTAARYVNDVVTESKTGHAYVSGIDLRRSAERWYDRVELQRVRWDDERGSSQGSRDTQSTSSRRSAERSTSSRSAAGQSSTASTADGWYPDPWAAESGMAERYYANGQWTEYTR